MAASQKNKQLLDLISDVKTRLEGKVDGISFPIPKFIVIGKQSVGKSRLIESLAGEMFNFVSGSLGSRRPTVLEFRNAKQPNRWYIWEDSTGSWKEKSVQEVCKIVGDAHESLGKSVTDVPVRVKVEGQDCVDLGIVDLPGFRAYSKDAEGQQLANKIEQLNQKFMNDENNVMLCVEEAGDNSGFSSLSKCKAIDPNYRRTILIRNKFDKYYQDLNSENVNKWLQGYGDLPPNLDRFALSLPHVGEGESFTKPFAEMRKECADRDVKVITDKGASPSFIKTVGFKNCQDFIQLKTTQLFSDALTPMMQRLQSMRDDNQEKLERIQEESEISDSGNILHATRSAGITFARSFNYLMQGALSSEHDRMTMEQELRAFHAYCQKEKVMGEKERHVEFFGHDLEKYIKCLRDGLHIPGMDVEVNGGAQFRRLMVEVEVFVRFAGLGKEFTAADVIQGRGAGTSWEEVIVKLIMSKQNPKQNTDAIRLKTKYVGERLKWFFMQQKEATVQFMLSMKGSPEEHMFSKLIPKKAEFIEGNKTMKEAIFLAFDEACQENLGTFVSMWCDYLDSMFQSPLMLLKSATVQKAAEMSEEDFDGCAPTFDGTKERIEREMGQRGQVANDIREKIKGIPLDDSQAFQSKTIIEEIIEDVFGRIRSMVADQMQLYAESFFLLPMLRRVEGKVARMELTDSDKRRYQEIKKILVEEEGKKTALGADLKWCYEAVQKFKVSCAP